MTKLTNRLQRSIRVYGVGDVNLALTPEGVEMSAPGKRKKLWGTWEMVALALQTPNDVKSYLHGRPLAFLKQQSGKEI